LPEYDVDSGTTDKKGTGKKGIGHPAYDRTRHIKVPQGAARKDKGNPGYQPHPSNRNAGTNVDIFWAKPGTRQILSVLFSNNLTALDEGPTGNSTSTGKQDSSSSLGLHKASSKIGKQPT